RRARVAPPDVGRHRRRPPGGAPDRVVRGVPVSALAVLSVDGGAPRRLVAAPRAPERAPRPPQPAADVLAQGHEGEGGAMIRAAGLGEQTGGEVTGVDVKALDDAGFAPIYRAWLDCNVVVVRDQALEIDDFLRYSRRFGVVVPPPSKMTRHP